jgi:quinol monooxygenase YgiN
MLSFTVRMTFNASDRDAVAGMLRELTAASRKEPGCVSYIAHFVQEEPATVLIYEQYLDESALDHHRSTPHFARFATAGLYTLMLDRQLEPLDAIA